MLKSISLKNYKCFKELNNLEIAPLTILCGVNSSGKSSILKSLLMLKQSFENDSDLNSLSLNGIYTNNGFFKDVVHDKKDNSFVLTTEFEIKNSSYQSSQEKQTIRDFNKMYPMINVDNLRLKIDFTIKNQNRKNITYGDNILSNILIKITINKNLFSSVNFELQQNKTYNIKLDNFPSNNDFVSFSLINTNCHFDNFKIVNLYFESVEPNNRADFVVANILTLYRIVALQFKDIMFLSPLRNAPVRRYILENDVDDVGMFGENTAQILEKSKEDKARINDIPDEKGFSVNYKRLNEKTPVAINKWLNYLGIDNYSVDPNGNDILRLSIGNNNILDVGFGVSQVLPLLTEGITSSYMESIILEQPEVHLHPEMQRNFADFLIAIAKSHKNVIVETHSDHIINRVVRRIMESKKTNSDLSNIVKIYLIEKDTNGSSVIPIRVNKYKGIVNASENFFTQFASEIEAIMHLGYENLEADNFKYKEEDI